MDILPLSSVFSLLPCKGTKSAQAIFCFHIIMLHTNLKLNRLSALLALQKIWCIHMYILSDD